MAERERDAKAAPSGWLPSAHFDGRHLLAGVLSGAVSTAALFPLDLVKTRFMVLNAHISGNFSASYTGYRDAVRSILRAEGPRAFWQGLTPAVVGAGSSWGLYFFFYENAKTRRQHDLGVHGAAISKLPAWQHLAAATEAGVCTAFLTNPIWLVKTRLQLQVHTRAPGPTPGAPRLYRGMTGAPRRGTTLPAARITCSPRADAFASIVREEGVLALYRGLVPALLLVSHGAIQVGARARPAPRSAPTACARPRAVHGVRGAEEIVRHQAVRAGALWPATGRQRAPAASPTTARRAAARAQNSLHTTAMASTSKLVASVATYPYQVVKARLQARGASTRYRGFAHCVVDTFRCERARGPPLPAVARHRRAAVSAATRACAASSEACRPTWRAWCPRRPSLSWRTRRSWRCFVCSSGRPTACGAPRFGIGLGEGASWRALLVPCVRGCERVGCVAGGLRHVDALPVSLRALRVQASGALVVGVVASAASPRLAARAPSNSSAHLRTSSVFQQPRVDAKNSCSVAPRSEQGVACAAVMARGRGSGARTAHRARSTPRSAPCRTCRDRAPSAPRASPRPRTPPKAPRSPSPPRRRGNARRWLGWRPTTAHG